jgi:hypothetical protein
VLFREDRRSPSAMRVFKGTALVGGNMIGLVAFDFILGIVFRGVMHMTFVVKISGVDRDNNPRHSACLGIPAYMIANLERLSHLVSPSAKHQDGTVSVCGAACLMRVKSQAR